MLFYCAPDVYCFRADCETVVADDPATAAEIIAGRWFEEGYCDAGRPLEVIVAEDDTGANALRFKVTRTITISDDAHEVGPVEVPDEE